MRRAFSASSAPAYDYDPYGAPLQSAPPVTDFAYSGTFQDPDSGLYLTRHRPYDPITGRFLTRDPLGETGAAQGNLYPYADGDPIDLADPTGLICWPAVFGNLLNWLGGPSIAPFILPAVTEAALGGPEDPLADLAVAAEIEALGAGASAEASAAAEGGGLAAEGVADTTTLFRAVTTPELESIQSLNAFTNPAGIEVKYFSTGGATPTPAAPASAKPAFPAAEWRSGGPGSPSPLTSANPARRRPRAR